MPRVWNPDHRREQMYYPPGRDRQAEGTESNRKK
jgi:hypothetical protein